MKSLLPVLSVILFLCAGCSPERHKIEQKKVASLTPYLIPVNSIDPCDTTFTDLEPLQAILKDKKIIMLGEQSHGDGTTFLAKTRLVKFLHQEMGFDVFAIESGMFDCEYAGSLIENGADTREAIKNSTFDIWTASRQFQPLIDYIDSTQKTNRPIRFTGFDLQITGKYGRDSLTTLLYRFLQNIPSISSTDSLSLQLLDTLTKKPKRFMNYPDSLRESFYVSLRSVIGKLESSPAKNKEFWIQELRSKETLARFFWNVNWNKPDPQFVNLRDRQMGENLIWLSRVRYPNKKIIVWAASSHISRNRREIINRVSADSAMIPMGHHVWSAMGDSVYTMGFTAYEGTMGLRGRNGTVLAKAKPGTLEDILYHKGNEFALLNFQQLPTDHWLRDTVYARPYGYTTMLARWPQMMDGIFYIKTMTPSIEVENP